MPIGTGRTSVTRQSPNVIYTYNWVNGLNLSYSSSTVVGITTGTAVDSTNSTLLNLSSSTTIDITGSAAFGGMDSKPLTGTASTNSSNATVTGSGTAFLTEFGTRTGSGTINVSASTTITGTSTLFLTEVTIGDLIGTASAGYSSITAIASNTSLTVASNLTISSAAYKVIENPTCQVASQTCRQVKAIASDTSLTLIANSSATQSGQTVSTGSASSDVGWYYIFVGTNGTNTGGFFSTQRTTPYSGNGFVTRYRRIGVVLGISGPSIGEFSQWGKYNQREYHYEFAFNTNGVRVLTSGTATSWTAVVMSGVVPSTSTLAHIRPSSAFASGAANTYIRPRNTGSSTATRPLGSGAQLSGDAIKIIGSCITDGAQCIDYAVASGVNLTIDVFGFTEEI